MKTTRCTFAATPRTENSQSNQTNTPALRVSPLTTPAAGSGSCWLALFAALALLASIISTPACSVTMSDRYIQNASMQYVASIIEVPDDKILLVDARSPEEYEQGTLPGAVNIPLPMYLPNNEDNSLRKFDYVIVFGDSPADARPAALTKRMLAREVDVFLMDAGFTQWQGQGLPVWVINAQ